MSCEGVRNQLEELFEHAHDSGPEMVVTAASAAMLIGGLEATCPKSMTHTARILNPAKMEQFAERIQEAVDLLEGNGLEPKFVPITK